jgi:hypothetical protein
MASGEPGRRARPAQGGGVGRGAAEDRAAGREWWGRVGVEDRAAN